MALKALQAWVIGKKKLSLSVTYSSVMIRQELWGDKEI